MIRVILFGMLAERAGCREITLNADGEGGGEGPNGPNGPNGSVRKLSDIVEEVREKYLKGVAGPLIYAVNEEQADPETNVKDGDEVAIMPPFSGG